MKKISLAVMRIQPMHNGHKLLIESMLQSSDKTIVAIGSTQISRTDNNPYTYEERVQMIRKVFPNDEVLVLPLVDIGASKKVQWTSYVLQEVNRHFGLTPTDYYTGSQADAYWFEGTLPIHIVCREKEGQGISATTIREKIKAKESLLGIIPQEVEEFTKEIEL